MSDLIHQGEIAGNYWNPDQYLKFSERRLRPALELLSRVPTTNPQTIYDLGCGAGQVARIIARQWPLAIVYGLDNSKEMLAQAAAEPGAVHWLEADIADWVPDDPPDLIYANAALHWLADHDQLFPRLIRFLRPGGCLAAQMPLSWDAPSHRLMRETLANGGPQGAAIGSEALRQASARKWVEDATTYYDLLADYAITLDIWETDYLQVLHGSDPVLEWVKGTGLRPILNSLDAAEQALFLVEYAQRLRDAYPIRADGRTLYPFRRLFIVATV
jgi:trans-aconitate 2-methyltransferase